MRLGGRAQAAIDVLSDIERRKRPVAEALKAWGLDHRFAGSGDRAAIGNLVYDALRSRASTQYLMDSDKTRRLVLGTLLRSWGYSAEALNVELAEDRHAPDPLREEGAQPFASRDQQDAEDHVRADIPQWLVPSFQANFDEAWVEEARGFAKRPPVNLRVNTLKAGRAKVMRALERAKAKETIIARHGLRIPAGSGAARQPNVTADSAYQKGFFEVQDEGSQIVSDLIFAQPGEQVLDLCAGAGGKSLALAAAMENRGQIHAYDVDRQRLKPIHERLRRAGVRNVQVHEPESDLSVLVGKMDRVVVDAPCTGTGTWRRHPHAKWKLTTEQLETRLTQQEEVFSQAAPFVRPGGFLIYITCSVLPEENENQVVAFLEENAEFELLSVGEVWQDLFGFDKLQPWSSDMKSITLTPASTGTDGFFIAVLGRKV
jgi:16S rRNA (cytosine967-C5)-methyltransferase